MLQDARIPVLLGFVLFYVVCVVLLLKILTGSFFPEVSLIQWDANWYVQIKDFGYSYNENAQSNVAFFPLFSYLWRFLGVGPLGISLVNLLIFIVAFYLFSKTYQLNFKLILFCLSLPSIFFLFVPYSESLFFLFGVILLLGLKRDNIPLVILGILGSVFTRSASNVFAPSLLICMVLCTDLSLKAVGKYLLYFIILIGSIMVVAWIQYIQTGVWFGFAKTQAFWGHSFGLPKLPFTSWSGLTIILLDATAFIFCMIAIGFLIKYFFGRVFKGKIVSADVTLSLLYLAAMVSIALLFPRGDMHSLNRYVYATPYFILLLLQIIKLNISYRYLFIWVFISLLLVSLLFGSYVHVSVLVKYIILMAYMSSILVVLIKYSESKYMYYIIAINFIIQAYFFSSFLTGQWVG